MASSRGVTSASPRLQPTCADATYALGTRSALGVFIEQELKKSGLSLNRFSKRAGVQPATVSNLINGEQQSANKKTLGKLAKALGREVWHLELLTSDAPIDVEGLARPTTPPGVLRAQSALEEAIDEDPTIPPRRKKWLKQCVEMSRISG